MSLSHGGSGSRPPIVFGQQSPLSPFTKTTCTFSHWTAMTAGMKALVSSRDILAVPLVTQSPIAAASLCSMPFGRPPRSHTSERPRAPSMSLSYLSSMTFSSMPTPSNRRPTRDNAFGEKKCCLRSWARPESWCWSMSALLSVSTRNLP
jgi:hypothetical protein